MLILSIVGARPNFMKVAPVMQALENLDARQLLVHTGQHYDANMSKIFFEELALPEPDIYLGVGSDTHARQTARIMTAFEDIVQQEHPDLVLVAGDVNSTVAAALVTAKQHIPLGHIEAGLRSFDRTMPEEVNRVVVDHLSDLLFVTEQSGLDNLSREGIGGGKVHLVGNCMVDSLLQHLENALAAKPWQAFDVEPGDYGLVTLHRPSNVDDPGSLERMLDTLGQAAQRLPLLFPMHPRTRARIDGSGLPIPEGLRLLDPQPYLAFLGLMARASLVLTDSGGIQEETTALDVPCLTLRHNTERPVTVERGSNRLVGTDPRAILGGVDDILEGRWRPAQRPPLWDGEASHRIADVIATWHASQQPN